MPKPVRPFAACLFLFLISAAPASAQSPEPILSLPALAAAKDLMVVTHTADLFDTMLPQLMMALKPAIVQGRSDVEKEFDALVPKLLAGFTSRRDEFLDKIAGIYARKFSAAELNETAAFFRSPTGQKFVQLQPSLMQESMTMGQQFGQEIGGELDRRMKEELRKKGYRI